MRGADTFTESLFTMRHLGDFVPTDHPQRVIRAMVNKALANMDKRFAQMYAADIKGACPSIAPEKRLRARLIQGAQSANAWSRPNAPCYFVTPAKPPEPA